MPRVNHPSACGLARQPVTTGKFALWIRCLRPSASDWSQRANHESGLNQFNPFKGENEKYWFYSVAIDFHENETQQWWL